MRFTIYTDGGCSGNKRGAGCDGAWAFVILDSLNSVIKNGVGLEHNTTNNRMEMSAVIHGLKCLKLFLDNNFENSQLHDCLIVSDSNYVVGNWNDYVPDWSNNNWRKSAGGMVVNSDLWKKIYSMSPEFKSFTFQWIKGHSTNKFNIQADALVRSVLYKKKGDFK